jgi:hypothetical protein
MKIHPVVLELLHACGQMNLMDAQQDYNAAKKKLNEIKCI